jgi:hypothetical protein
VHLDVPNYLLLFHKVSVIPLLVGARCGFLIKLAPVLQQLIEELNGEHFDVLEGPELGDVYMSSTSDVEKDTIHEVEEQLQLKVLAPGQAQVKEEFAKPLEFDQVGLVPLFVLEVGPLLIV